MTAPVALRRLDCCDVPPLLRYRNFSRTTALLTSPPEVDLKRQRGLVGLLAVAGNTVLGAASSPGT